MSCYKIFQVVQQFLPELLVLWTARLHASKGKPISISWAMYSSLSDTSEIKECVLSATRNSKNSTEFLATNFRKTNSAGTKNLFRVINESNWLLCLMLYCRSVLRTCQRSKMEFLKRIVKLISAVNYFPKKSILVVWQSSEYASVLYVFKVNKKGTGYALFNVNCENIYHKNKHINQ